MLECLPVEEWICTGLFVALLVGSASALVALGVIQRDGEIDGQGLIPLHFARPAAYIAGTLAAYWMIDCVAGFVV